MEETNTDFGTAPSPFDSIEIKDSELENESNSPEQDINNVDDAIDENESSVLDQDTPQSAVMRKYLSVTIFLMKKLSLRI